MSGEKLQLPAAPSRRGNIEREQPRSLKVAGLFAGIGGLERGLARAGHRTLLLCEIEPGAKAVLGARFPDVRLESDVTQLEALPKQTDLLVGGFPCQDLSQAGKTVGIRGENSGLVSHVFRLVEQGDVPRVLLENVPFMLQLAGGRAMEVLVTEFERMGYRWAYRVVDSRAFGLPQRRQRVLFYATRNEDPRAVLFAEDEGEPVKPERADDVACGFYWTEGVRGLGWAVDAIPTLKGGSTVGVPSPPAIVFPNGEVGTPTIGDAERLQGFPKGWTKPAEQVVRTGHRWKLVGNAVSVPVAAWVGRQLSAPAIFKEWMTPGARPLPLGSRWPTAAWDVGDGRCAAPISAWPRHFKRKGLVEFLTEEPKPLSERATAGFLERTRRGSLRFPPGFIETLERYLRRVAKEAPTRTA